MWLKGQVPRQPEGAGTAAQVRLGSSRSGCAAGSRLPYLLGTYLGNGCICNTEDDTA